MGTGWPCASGWSSTSVNLPLDHCPGFIDQPITQYTILESTFELYRMYEHVSSIWQYCSISDNVAKRWKWNNSRRNIMGSAITGHYIGQKHLWQCQLNEAWREGMSTYQMNRLVQPVLVMFPQDSLLLQVVSDLRLYHCEFLDHTPPQWLTKTKVIVLVSHDLMNDWLVKFFYKILQSWWWPNKIWELEVLFAIIITEMYMFYTQRLHRIHNDLQRR